ncbi:MAG TPA: hypothetical protein VHF50_04950 [Solirubrobacterales bacterium]|nr:hypothetical protein [Solirubrobacterales bacterium]
MSIDRPAASSRTPHSVVPLEAGGGPENPPCPSCAEPLFGWVDERPGLAGPVRRCESCGLGVVGDPPSAAEALGELVRQQRGEVVRIANRGSFSAWIGGAGWAGLTPGARCLFTVEAVRRLVGRRDEVVRGARWATLAGVATMWQTVLNGFTFGRNVALGALGRSESVPADRSWQRRLDTLISIAVALPALLVALPMEGIAAALGRGSAVDLETEVLR